MIWAGENKRECGGKQGGKLLLPSGSSWLRGIESNDVQFVLVSCRFVGRFYREISVPR